MSIPRLPEVFLREDFNLSNLETFNEVLTSVSRLARNDLTFNDNRRPHKSITKEGLRELQLSIIDHLDVIEEKLSNSVSNRSGDFFQVMSSIHSVLDELSSAIKSVTSLRVKCSTLSEALIVPNKRITHLTMKRNKTQSILDKLIEISELCMVQHRIQLLLSASDYVGALDLIAKTRIILHQDFKRVACLRHLESQLAEVENKDVINMVKDEIDVRLRSWEAKPPVPSPQFNGIVQLLTHLYENKQVALPANELKMLFYQLGPAFETVLLSHLHRLRINRDAGPKYMLARQELALFKKNLLSKSTIFDDWDLNYDEIWSKLQHRPEP